MSKYTSEQLRKRRHQRLRQKVKGTAERPRLCVNRSLRHIHVQLIDDVAGVTVASANTLQKEMAGQIDGAKGNRQAARVIGENIARLAVEKGVQSAVFDRNGYLYHGVVQELADAVRAGGLKI
jgi:large subunit ribosomal protein L18